MKQRSTTFEKQNLFKKLDMLNFFQERKKNLNDILRHSLYNWYDQLLLMSALIKKIQHRECLYY